MSADFVNSKIRMIFLCKPPGCPRSHSMHSPQAVLRGLLHSSQAVLSHSVHSPQAVLSHTQYTAPRLSSVHSPQAVLCHTQCTAPRLSSVTLSARLSGCPLSHSVHSPQAVLSHSDKESLVRFRLCTGWYSHDIHEEDCGKMIFSRLTPV